MRVQNIRFSDAAWEVVCTEAAQEGMSASAFVRESALMRAMWSMARRGGATIDGYEEVSGMVRVEMQRRGLL